jgi:hypothetical protein
VAVPDHTLAPIRKARPRHHGQERLGFRFHRLRKEPARTTAQNGRQWVVGPIGLTEGNNGAIARHGVSLLREVQAGSSPASIRRLPHTSITQFRA